MFCIAKQNFIHNKKIYYIIRNKNELINNGYSPY